MKRFHWSLHRVLDVTEKREKAVRAELFALVGRIARLQDDIARRGETLRRLLADLGAMEFQEQLLKRDVFLRCLANEQRTLASMRTRLGAMLEQREEATRRLVEVSTRKETLQRLEDEARKRHDSLMNQRDQSELDEAFQVGFARRVQDRLTVRTA